MNEALFVTVVLLSLMIVFVAVRLGIPYLIGVIVTFLLTANLFASKLTIIFGVTSSLAIPLYAAIFLATDSLAEHYGKEHAYRAVKIGFLAQLCLLGFGQILIRVDHIESPQVAEIATSLWTIFDFIPRIILGSFVAYLLSQNLDVYLYGRLKARFNDKHLWLRNCVSTPISQGLDTIVFLPIAFYGVLPHLGQFMLAVWVLKVAIALIDTPFIYLTYPLLGKEYPGSRQAARG